MFELFNYDFILKAFFIGNLFALVCGIMGNFIVAGRQSITSEMIAHSSLAGVGIGLFIHFSPNLIALIISVLSALLLYFLGKSKKISKDAIAMALLSGGIALALLFAHLAKDNPIPLDNFLFGSILTISSFEVIVFSIICMGILVILLLFWNRFLCIVFDIEFFYSRFSYPVVFELTFIIMLALLISISLKIIGSLLVGSLLVISVISAQKIAHSFMKSVLYAIVFNILGVSLGIFLSFYFDIPTSSAIVLCLLGIMFSVYFAIGILNLIKKTS